MNTLDCKELHFIVDGTGALIAFKEKDVAWAGVLAFSSEAIAREFIRLSRVDAHELAALAVDDTEGVAALVSAVKRRPIRYLLLDLDYGTGKCRRIEFEGDRLGAVTECTFTAADHRHQNSGA